MPKKYSSKTKIDKMIIQKSVNNNAMKYIFQPILVIVMALVLPGCLPGAKGVGQLISEGDDIPNRPNELKFVHDNDLFGSASSFTKIKDFRTSRIGKGVYAIESSSNSTKSGIVTLKYLSTDDEDLSYYIAQVVQNNIKDKPSKFKHQSIYYLLVGIDKEDVTGLMGVFEGYGRYGNGLQSDEALAKLAGQTAGIKRGSYISSEDQLVKFFEYVVDNIYDKDYIAFHTYEYK